MPWLMRQLKKFRRMQMDKKDYSVQGKILVPLSLLKTPAAEKLHFHRKGISQSSQDFGSVLQQEYSLMAPYSVFPRFYDTSKWCNFSCGVRL